MHILLIQPDRIPQRAMYVRLSRSGFRVSSISTWERASSILDIADAVLVAKEMREMAWHECVERIHAVRPGLHVFLWSQDIPSADELERHGIDESYVVAPPFKKAHVRDIILEKLNPLLVERKEYKVETYGEFELDITFQRLKIRGTPVHLTSKEFQVLELLCCKQGTSVTKEMLLNHLYGGMDPDSEPEQKIIDVFICKLRKKLRVATNGNDYIETVWGRGYTITNLESARIAAE